MVGAGIRSLEPALSDQVAAAYIVDGEGLVDPSLLIKSLQARLAGLGVALLERHRVSGLVVESRTVRAVIIGDEELACKRVVIAAGTTSASLLAALGVKVRMQVGKGYSFSADLDPTPTRPLFLGDAHVAVSPLGGRTRIAGTMEFSGDNRRLDWRRIEAIARASRPYLGPWFEETSGLMALIQNPWVGGRPLLPDGLPVIDQVPTTTNAYVATGHGMLGVTLAPSTAEALVRQMREGRRPAVLAPFAIQRAAAWDRGVPA